MESSVCWNKISYRFKKSFANQIRDLILNQDSYSQVFKLVLSQQFVHAIPSLTFYIATIMFVRRNHNFFKLSGLAKSLNTKYFVPGQVLLIWMLINTSLTFWLLFQKVLYCFVWYSFSQETKPWLNFGSEHWWFSGETEQLETTFSLGSYLWQPEYVSWFLAEIIAATIFYTMNMPLFKRQDKLEKVQKKFSDSVVINDMFDMGDSGKELTPPLELCQVRCRKGRPPSKPYVACPAEVCTKENYT